MAVWAAIAPGRMAGREKGWQNPLSFMRRQDHISADPFDESWFLGGQSREMFKKGQ